MITTVWFQTVERNINWCILSGRQLCNISETLKILFELDFRCLGIYSKEVIIVVFEDILNKFIEVLLMIKKKLKQPIFLTDISIFNNYSTICVECLLCAKQSGFVKSVSLKLKYNAPI